MADALALLALLIGLELVLGVDNILVITIFVGRLPKSHRNKARVLGLGVALLARILLLFILLTLSNLTQAVVLHFSIRDLILLSGGLFLLYKAVREIHHAIELKEEEQHANHAVSKSFASVIFQIVLTRYCFLDRFRYNCYRIDKSNLDHH